MKRRLLKYLNAGFFNEVPLSIAVVDTDYNVIGANRTFEEKYGGWKGKKCHSLYKSRDTKCHDCAAALTFQDGKVRTSQERGIDSTGKRFFYLIHILPYRDKKGRVLGVVEMSQDITDKVMLEREHHFISDHVPCYMAVIDRDYRVVRMNKFAQEIFGGKPGDSCHWLFKKSDGRCKDCPVAKVFADGKTCEMIQTGIDKNGKEKTYIVTSAPLDPEKEEITQVIEVALDITEVLNLKKRLAEVEKEKLEAERLAAVGQTVAGLSHGIKNVLMGLEGGMYVVNSGLKREDDAVFARGWSMLENNIARISTLTKEFLSFAKGTEPEPSLVNPVAVAKQVVDLFSPLAKKAGIELVAELDDTVKEAVMDPEGIHACLSNLVSNAIDACQISDRKELKIVVSCQERDGTIYFVVRDNGSGMDYDVKKKVFTSFFTTKASGEGTGLGLLVTRRIVNQHGGTINFESERGQGSVFTLAFNRDRLPKLENNTGEDAQPDGEKQNSIKE